MQVLFPRSSAFRCGALAMSTSVGLRVAHAQTALRTAQAVCFDVDSTVVTSEGIDDLAAYLGCGDKVAALTAQAMGGSMPFHEALALRLSAMKPSQQQVTSMLAEEPLKLTDGVADLIAVLHSRGQHVYFVSGGACANRPRRQTQNSHIYVSRASQYSRGFHGAASLAGFRQFIEPIAAQVNVAKTDIYANTLLFNADGSFKGHLESEPTSRAGGKAKVGRRPDRCRCRCWCWCLVWLRDDVRVLSECRLSVCAVRDLSEICPRSVRDLSECCPSAV
jgi:phosphoserine phosphatase